VLKKKGQVIYKKDQVLRRRNCGLAIKEEKLVVGRKASISGLLKGGAFSFRLKKEKEKKPVLPGGSDRGCKTRKKPTKRSRKTQSSEGGKKNEAYLTSTRSRGSQKQGSQSCFIIGKETEERRRGKTSNLSEGRGGLKKKTIGKENGGNSCSFRKKGYSVKGVGSGHDFMEKEAEGGSKKGKNRTV